MPTVYLFARFSQKFNPSKNCLITDSSCFFPFSNPQSFRRNVLRRFGYGLEKKGEGSRFFIPRSNIAKIAIKPTARKPMNKKKNRVPASRSLIKATIPRIGIIILVARSILIINSLRSIFVSPPGRAIYQNVLINTSPTRFLPYRFIKNYLIIIPLL